MRKYKDYRKMFDKEGENIDAVMIATPDHMHTPVALHAMQLGKHVYCEKPLTRTAWEAQLLVDAAAKYKVATQMGNQGWSHEGTKTACKIFWSGEIGEVRELHSWTGRIYGGQPDIPETGPEPTPVPSTLDWDLWLGCAEARAFHPLMTNQWRAFTDFSTGGSLGDWLVHNLGTAHLALERGCGRCAHTWSSSFRRAAVCHRSPCTRTRISAAISRIRPGWPKASGSSRL